MKRVRRLAQFWNWLPAFRAVAESEHLPTAAAELGVSPPGLSRMIRLIENDLGRDLFRRLPRKIELNEAGQLFLGHVREAMRRIDDGLQALEGRTFKGPIRISASNSVALAYVLPAAEALSGEYPEMMPELVQWDAERACEALRKGQIDIALLEGQEVSDDLAVELLTTISYGLYCAADHELAARPEVTLDDCLAFSFVAGADKAEDSWPVNQRRKIGLRVSALNLALAVCASGRLLALLPDDVAQTYPAPLVRLPCGTLAEGPVHVAYRPPLGRDPDRVTVFLDTLRQVVA